MNQLFKEFEDELEEYEIPTYRLLAKPTEYLGISFPFLILLVIFGTSTIMLFYVFDHAFIGIFITAFEYLLIKILYSITPYFFSILRSNLFIIKPNAKATKFRKVFTWVTTTNYALDHSKIDKQLDLLITSRLTENRNSTIK